LIGYFRWRFLSGQSYFVTVGSNITVDGITFRNAAVPDKNGAGIRVEGPGLHVLRSQFIKNENSILTRSGLGGTLIMRQNKLTKGPVTSNNSSFIAYGMEGVSNPSTTISIIGNSFVNRLPRGTYLFMMKAGPSPLLRRNSQ
jgi:hypothetical protein